MIFSHFWRTRNEDLKETIKYSGVVISTVIVIANIVFISIAAVVFMRLENENMIENAITRSKRFEDLKGWMEGKGSYVFSPDEWGELYRLHKSRCFKANNQDAHKDRFNFWTSLDFCSTMISTIGYGSLYPDRDIGKMASVFYCLFGIPLMLCFLNICCDALTGTLSVIIKKCCKLRSRDVRLLKVLIIFTAVCSYTTILSYILTSYSENDTMVTSLYFYVITLTTTGIGDISMVDHNALILVRVFAVFLLGLTLVTTLINSIRDAARKRAKPKHFKAIGNMAMQMALMNKGISNSDQDTSGLLEEDCPTNGVIISKPDLTRTILKCQGGNISGLFGLTQKMVSEKNLIKENSDEEGSDRTVIVEEGVVENSNIRDQKEIVQIYPRDKLVRDDVLVSRDHEIVRDDILVSQDHEIYLDDVLVSRDHNIVRDDIIASQDDNIDVEKGDGQASSERNSYISSNNTLSDFFSVASESPTHEQAQPKSSYL